MPDCHTPAIGSPSLTPGQLHVADACTNQLCPMKQDFSFPGEFQAYTTTLFKTKYELSCVLSLHLPLNSKNEMVIEPSASQLQYTIATRV